MVRIALIAFLWAAHAFGRAAGQGECAAEAATIADLKKKLAAAEAARIGTAAAAHAGVGLVTEAARGLYTQAAQHEHVTSAMKVTAQAQEHFTKVDYNKAYDSVRPYIDAAHGAAQPYLKEYVYPAHAEYVQPMLKHAQPHLDKAAEVKDQCVKAYNEHVAPHVEKHGATAYGHASRAYEHASRVPEHLTRFQEASEAAVDKIFQVVGGLVPEHRHLIPSAFGDRLLVLLFAIIFVSNVVVIARFLLKVLFKVGTKSTSIILRYFVFLPLKIVLWPVRLVLSLYIRTVTCCFCCGLCRKRKAEAAAAAPNGAATKENGTTPEKPKGNATADELIAFIKDTKDKKKVPIGDVVKQLVEASKTGKPVNPKNYPKLQGKTITKDVLKKALAKFPEVDVKKLKL